MKPRLAIPLIILLAIVAGFFVYPALLQKGGVYPSFLIRPFRLGLDLLGGTHLVYEADLSQIPDSERSAAMNGLRDVIERRVNLFGVAEPLVAVNKANESWRLVVELAGVKDINQAIQMIGQTPYLEFKEERPESETSQILKSLNGQTPDPKIIDPYFVPTALTGRYLKKSTLIFEPTSGRPEVLLEFDDIGKQIFGEITKKNVGKRLAIYLDGYPISAPVVQQEILNGDASITGNFSVAESRQLVARLNSGALPVPISVLSQQNIGASLGHDYLVKSLVAGIVGFILVALFMIICAYSALLS